MLHPTFQKNLPKVIILLKKHKIKNAYAFGSVVTDKFNSESDIDLIINFQDNLDPLVAGEHWWNLHDELRELLHREIDLVTERSLKNPYFIKELNQTKLHIYG
ncbi:MAG: nucleotidyltransferase [Bacteroidetes bacterium GWA2_30_7]|nr:MAG: nucleotidyltransferase [Bacteroidetes bacterium GWA2_30_7]